MKEIYILGWGRYADTPVEDLPLLYILRVLSFEPPDSRLSIFLRGVLEKRAQGIVPAQKLNSQRKPSFKVHRRRHCPITRKRCFVSKGSARKRIREIRIEPGANHYRIPRRAYCCEFCGYWHLTSRPDYRLTG